jgi:hypothetical protein
VTDIDETSEVIQSARKRREYDVKTQTKQRRPLSLMPLS